MNRLVLPLIALLGFAAGWSLPAKSTTAPVAAATLPSSGENTRRELRKRALLESLLSYFELDRHQTKSASLNMLLTKKWGNGLNDEDITRIVDMDPVASMNELLSNPIAPSGVAERVALEWTRRQPVEALRYLREKHSYRADNCLAAALPAAYLTHPQLVGEILRSKPKKWQEHYLTELFKNTYGIRKPGAPPPPEPTSEDPFATDDDGNWMEIRFGNDLLDCLADDDLRAKVKTLWEKGDDSDDPFASLKSPPEPEGPASWDPATYDPDDSRQRDALITDLRDKKEETIARIAAGGNHATRAQIVGSLAAEVRYSYKQDPEWMAALERLEAGIHQFGVIPASPPSHFEQGPFLYGKEVAGWIDRQPLGLRRAWAPTFVETWAQYDPHAAIEWAHALPEEASRVQAFQTGLIVWTHQDPLAASHHLEDLPPGELREAAISNAAATWDCIDPDAAREWVAALPDSPGKQRALERLNR